MCSNQQKLVPILLLQGIKFTTLKTMCCVCARSLSSFGLFASPWTVTQQAPVHGIFQARLLEQVAFPIPGDLPNPGIEPESLARDVDGLFTTVSPKKPLKTMLLLLLLLSRFSRVRLCVTP